jgi:MSHA pilin protein MshA
MRRDKMRGFTLIELVVVITILGILAAFAVPRFIGLQTEARKASMESLLGALRSASAITHSMWLIRGGNTVAMEGMNIAMANGYPTYDSIDDTLVDSSGFAYDDTNGEFTKVGAASAATCNVTYTPPANPGDPPSFLFDLSNCS